MIPKEFDEILARTLDDGALSRGEQQALRALVADQDPASLPALRSRAFAAARAAVDSYEPGVVLDWVEAVQRVLAPPAAELPDAEALFSPGEGVRQRLMGLFAAARRTVDICVFTITDDALSREIYEASRRGVHIRIVTDDDKALDRGSDIADLERAGIPVRVDRSPSHMHHKFALFDGRTLASGSYNWTRSAFLENQENLIVTNHPQLLRQFQAEFDGLWGRLG
ncbi:MAG: endonuclease [Myxococcales bacterium]|nr:endonuclease [Myxococcales bacterium]MCB9544509.1 endonuclease [Myxococcales bacterium]